MANPQHKTCLSVLRSVIGSAAGNEARFAEKIGRSTSWLKKASCGQIPLTENIALRISHETGISMRWLMQRDTSKTPVDKDDKTFTKATYENYRSPDHFPGKGCDCEARSSYECGCDADWTPKEVYDLRGEVVALKAFAESIVNENKKLNKEVDDLIRKPLLVEDFKQERDEAREDAQKSKAYKKVLKVTNENLKRERDEAREDREKIKTELEMWRDGNIFHEIHRNELEKVE